MKMAPMPFTDTATSPRFHISRSLFNPTQPQNDLLSTLSSAFSLASRHVLSIASRALKHFSPTEFTTHRSHLAAAPLAMIKRQTAQSGSIVAIPITYAGLNDGPSPGEVAGIVLGSVGGLLLALLLLYFGLRLGGYFSQTTVIEEREVIRERRRSRSDSRSEMSERRSEHSHRPPRREVRREEIIVEARTSRVDPPEDDIVEVIEEHSPERRPNRRESKRMSGFRTVDPDEFGGGDRPMRRVSKR